MQKILVIDDNVFVRETIIKILEDEGYSVIVAPDGRTGLSVFRDENPDLVLTDIVMPDQEGIATIRIILSTKRDAKVIAISGGAKMSNVDLLRLARRAGACDVLAKPFDPDDLLAMVAKNLAG